VNFIIISYRSLIILYCINQIKSERSIFGIYHLLTGKKSSQTISDANLYQLAHLFSIFTQLKREELVQCVNDLCSKGLVTSNGENKYTLTTSGSQFLADMLTEYPLPTYLNGWQYYDIGTDFWQRLSLCIQVLSNVLYEKKNYITIEQDEKHLIWIKEFLFSKNITKEKLATSIFQECKACLSGLSDLESTIFVLRLSSFERIGLTYKQIALLLKQDETRIQLLFFNVLHFMLRKIESAPEEYRLLYEISNLSRRILTLTESTQKTFKLIQEGKTIEEIVKVRGLKRNTIEDHIVEIAHNVKSFNISPYVSPSNLIKISKAQRDLQTMKLKPIKDHVGSDVSFFEIRLVLARRGDYHEA